MNEVDTLTSDWVHKNTVYSVLNWFYTKLKIKFWENSDKEKVYELSEVSFSVRLTCLKKEILSSISPSSLSQVSWSVELEFNSIHWHLGQWWYSVNVKKTSHKSRVIEVQLLDTFANQLRIISSNTELTPAMKGSGTFTWSCLGTPPSYPLWLLGKTCTEGVAKSEWYFKGKSRENKVCDQHLSQSNGNWGATNSGSIF